MSQGFVEFLKKNGWTDADIEGISDIKEFENIRNTFFAEPYIVRGTKYATALPKELAPWYCYASDVGHSIAVLSKQLLETEYRWKQNNDAPAGLLSLIPVKSALELNYTVYKNCLVYDLPYDPMTGIVCDDSDVEY